MRFSVIIPVYNVAPYLRECLDSVLAQSFADWEAICVDDGSTDGSGAILDEYAKKDMRIRVIRQNNAGVSAARNAALDRVEGEWVVFADGDDALVPRALETLNGIVESSGELDMIRYHEQSVFSMDDPLPASASPGMVNAVSIDSPASAKIAYDEVGGGILAWNCAYRYEALTGLRFRPFRNGEDGLFGLEAFLRARRVAKLQMALYRYRVDRKGSAVSNKTFEHVRSMCDVILLSCSLVARWKFVNSVSPAFHRWVRVMVGRLFSVASNTAKERRRECWENIRQTMLKLTAEYRPFCGGDWRRWRLAAVSGAPWAMQLFVNVPFAVRVWLLKVPGVESLKRFVRRAR